MSKYICKNFLEIGGDLNLACNNRRKRKSWGSPFYNVEFILLCLASAVLTFLDVVITHSRYIVI